MKKSLMLIACMFFLLSTAMFAQNKYIGSAKCKMCHNSPAKGEQFKKWSESKHAKALASLTGADATNAKCLKCHAPVAEFKAEGVTCEACHGAGSAYKSPTVMKDAAQSKAKGLIIPGEKACLTCHGKGLGNPKDKDFNYTTYLAKVTHKAPKK